ncbi:MAG: HAD hydrolase family protein [Candidatus Abawacabacteria bacterium]|nr:HAD hydrolase family protein [Candidatus Abawacabacteria bacterium]
MIKLGDAESRWMREINTVATDVDGTLTDASGHFSPDFIAALQLCQRNNIRVLLVTGRPAPWVQGMVEYLPVAGGIGENGGIFCPKEKEANMRLLVGDNDELPLLDWKKIEADRLARMAIFEILKKSIHN